MESEKKINSQKYWDNRFSNDWKHQGRQTIGNSEVHVLTAGNVLLYINNAVYQNPILAEDTNGSGIVTPVDALLVINCLNLRALPNKPPNANSQLDVNGDTFITPLDALLVINKLNARSREGEGESNSLKHSRSEGEGFVGDYWSDDELTEDIRQARVRASTNSYLRVGKSLARGGR